MSSWRNAPTGPLHSPPPGAVPSGPGMTVGLPASTTAGPNNSNSLLENGPRAKCDQVVFEAIAKAAEIVVGSRCWIDHVPSNNSTPSSSRRFNLLVPEVQGVRSILQRWKRALHVPLRLDVYYQHEDSRRELLERWCLEYAPKTSTHQGFVSPSADPIVQLRQVCKQLVIWLRSLYCWSRMLPAQALRSQNTNNSAIGFSIYVVSEGNDDVSGLVSQQGFCSQAQPHSVWTPYGELGWKVFYAPKEIVQRLIPESPPYTNASQHSRRVTSQPIPMQQQHHQQQQHQQQIEQKSYHPARTFFRQDSSPQAAVARSAPQHYNGKSYLRSKSDVSEEMAHAMAVAQSMTQGGDMDGYEAQQPLQHPSQGQAPHSEAQISMGNRPRNEYSMPIASGTDSKPPTKNMSALSLAMMMVNDDGAATANKPPSKGKSTNDEAAEKRRAALHHAPPQLPQSSPTPKKTPLSNPGEYGYGYNNHIPPLRSNGQQTPPAQHGAMPLTNPTPNRMDGLASPATTSASVPLGSTPPGYLLGGPTPPAMVPNLANLIPPRGGMTPPFTRPMGFVGEAPSQPSPPAVSTPHAHSNEVDRTSGAGLPPTSLDLLHSSPFQQPAYGSMFGGGSITPGDPFASSGMGMGGDPTMLFGGSVGSGGFHMHPRLQSMDDPDDMPFAVDSSDALGGDTVSSEAADQAGVSSSSAINPMASLTSSTMMRDMSQPPKRLQLFDSIAAESALTQQDQKEDVLGSLADQLAEFKNFGASLTIQPSPSGSAIGGSATQGEVGASSTSTPISLRT